MKKFFKVTLALVVLVSSVSMFSSCSDSDPVPSDVITDEDGIRLSLHWSITGGTESQALSAADLDIEIYETDPENKVDYTISTSSFDAINMYTDDYDDGTYLVKVYLWETDVDVNYVLTANGISVSAPVTFTSNFDSEDDGRKVETFTIKKAGSKYTITQ